MASLFSKTTKTVYLSGYYPNTTSYQTSALYTIQGSTTLNFILTSISSSYLGIRKLYGTLNGVNTFTIQPLISSGVSSMIYTLPQDSVYVDIFNTSSYTTLSTFNVIALYRNGLSATHITTFIITPDNLLDMDINILNTQTSYVSGIIIPIINLESKNNIIYPVAYTPDITASVAFNQVYMLTDPEIDTSLSATSFSALSVSNYIDTQDSYRLRAL